MGDKIGAQLMEMVGGGARIQMKKTQNFTGSYIRMLRREAGINQSEIADMLGIKRTTYSHYETGRIRPSSDKLVQLADYYQVPLDSLIRKPAAIAESTAEEEEAPGRKSEDTLTRPQKSQIPEITADDLLFLAAFHHLTGKEQKAVWRMLKEMAEE